MSPATTAAFCRGRKLGCDGSAAVRSAPAEALARAGVLLVPADVPAYGSTSTRAQRVTGAPPTAARQQRVRRRTRPRSASAERAGSLELLHSRRAPPDSVSHKSGAACGRRAARCAWRSVPERARALRAVGARQQRHPCRRAAPLVRPRSRGLAYDCTEPRAARASQTRRAEV